MFGNKIASVQHRFCAQTLRGLEPDWDIIKKLELNIIGCSFERESKFI